MGVCETCCLLLHITEEGFLGCGDADGFNGWGVSWIAIGLHE
jgi:hypothetical protein